jgi:hypothetical protein
MPPLHIASFAYRRLKQGGWLVPESVGKEIRPGREARAMKKKTR